MLVHFVKEWNLFKPGERVSLDDSLARELIEKGIAARDHVVDIAETHKGNSKPLEQR